MTRGSDVRSPSVSERGGVAALLVASVLALACDARADDKQICADAYPLTQTLRQAGQLTQAREQALLCPPRPTRAPASRRGSSAAPASGWSRCAAADQVVL
jgi:hypothetical protein